jgi:eukaryotic-like serine/threonine-protein kinase
MSRMTDQVGRVLGGRYRLLSPLGSGASAQVYLADDVRLRRRVAVKVLHAALADDESFLRRFRAEAQAAAALSHPHLLAVYDWSGDDDTPYLVTEYLSGGSLRSLLDAGHRLEPAQALVVGLEAARALDHAHRQGFVHRDIKPANLLFGADARLRVADFGLARAIAEAAWTEPAGAMLGTARYASPEQARGEPVDGRSDVYSLALVLVESVTGQVPFTVDTTIGTLMARLDRPLDVPDELGPLAPALTAAGRLDPSERPDAAAFGGALVDAAAELTRPVPLPLPGASPTPNTPVDQRDRTLMGPSAQVPAVALAAGAEAPTVGLAAAGPLALAASPVPGSAAPAVETTRLTVARTGATGVMAPPPDVPYGAPAGARAWQTGELPRPGLSADDRRARRLILWAVMVTVAVTAGVVGSWLYMRAQVPSHTIPTSLVGAHEDEARRAVGGFGWIIEVEELRQDGTEPGQVVATEPRPGTELREGETLTLHVSLGATLVALPSGVVGSTEEDATAALEGAGLVAKVVRQVNEDVDEGVVFGIADEPPDGQVPKGSTVTLLVSSGDELEIPDLEGEAYTDAKEQLEAMGLVVELRGQRPRGNQAAGEVIGTDPDQGEEVDPGDTVEVIVATEPVAVPSVEGSSAEEARQAIEGAGLQVGAVIGPEDGVVIITNPGGGSEVDLGSTVDLILRPGG